VPTAGAAPRPGDMLTAEITYAAPHHLVADVVRGLRRTRAGDAWEARAGKGPTTGITLGMPSVGVPAPSAPVADGPGCSGYLVDSAVGHVAGDVTSP
jgi:tRNA-2-methylthio-N6-dimethylallyladenosine synthase